MTQKEKAAKRATMWGLDRNVTKLGGFKIGDQIRVMARGSFRGSALHTVEGFAPAGVGLPDRAELKRPDGAYTLQWLAHCELPTAYKS